ncbi:MAG TPA: DNA repair protein RecO [Gemmatimonadota bacterium]|nr:DNA repair protein RecO [Gemmatimonadota bacterium]
MPIVTSHSVVLQAFRYSDTSKILRLLTRDRGPVSVIARGALRARSRLSGLLEPFAEGSATFYLKSNRDLHTLSGFELIRERQALGVDLARFAGASVLCELVMRVAPREADPGLFDFLVAALDELMEVPEPQVRGVAAARIWQLVALLGFGPSVAACVDCGRPPEAGRPARFDLAAGGLRCHRCPQVGRYVGPDEVDALVRLASGDPSLTPSPAHLALLSEFIRWHAAEGSRIRSLDFFTAPS